MTENEKLHEQMLEFRREVSGYTPDYKLTLAIVFAGFVIASAIRDGLKAIAEVKDRS